MMSSIPRLLLNLATSVCVILPAFLQQQRRWGRSLLLVQADCFPETLSLRERMEETPVVARLVRTAAAPVGGNATSGTAQRSLPCSIEIYDEIARGYLLERDGYTSYTIVEIFRQDWTSVLSLGGSGASTNSEMNATTTTTELDDQEQGEDAQQLANLLQPGMEIAVVYDTDTGFYKNLPSSLSIATDIDDGGDEGGGFLAFLTPYRYCVETRVDAGNFVDASIQVVPYEQHGIMVASPTDDTATAYNSTTRLIQENPFLLNECVDVNQLWRSVSKNDADFLRSLDGYIPPLVATTTTPEEEDEGEPEEQEEEEEEDKNDKNQNNEEEEEEEEEEEPEGMDDDVVVEPTSASSNNTTTFNSTNTTNSTAVMMEENNATSLAVDASHDEETLLVEDDASTTEGILVVDDVQISGNVDDLEGDNTLVSPETNIYISTTNNDGGGEGEIEPTVESSAQRCRCRHSATAVVAGAALWLLAHVV